MELFKFFMGEKWQNLAFLGRSRTLVSIPIAQRGIGTGTKSWGTGTHSPERDWYRYRTRGYQY